MKILNNFILYFLFILIISFINAKRGGLINVDSLQKSTTAASNQQQLNPIIFSSKRLLSSCDYFLNSTDVQKLNQHEYVAFEQCLYYYLASRAKKLGNKNFRFINSIATLPPVAPYNGVISESTSQNSVRVQIGQLTLQHFQLNEFLKELNIFGYFEMQWEDSRLSWNVSQWKVNHLQIHSASNIWMPILSSQSYETSLQNNEAMEARRIKTSSTGNVSAIISFSLKTFCDDSDFRHFPDDIYKCCFSLEPHINQDLIEFIVDGLPVFTDTKYFRDYGWYVSGTIPSVNLDPNVIAQLNFCINLQRASSSVKIELAVPTWSSAILLLFSPFFGSILSQIYLKLFLLLIQICTLMLFSNRIAPHLGSASATPVLMAIHELAIILNVISIIFSIIVLTFGRIQRNLPPWRWLLRASQITNKILFLFNTTNNLTNSSSMIGHYCYYDTTTVSNNNFEIEKGSCTINGITKTNNNVNSTELKSVNYNGRYQVEWNTAFQAIHALGTTIISITFIFGYLLIN